MQIKQVLLLLSTTLALAISALAQIAPSNPTLGSLQQQQFTLQGYENVTWMVEPSTMGTITPNGLYTAPNINTFRSSAVAFIYAQPTGGPLFMTLVYFGSGGSNGPGGSSGPGPSYPGEPTYPGEPSSPGSPSYPGGPNYPGSPSYPGGTGGSGGVVSGGGVGPGPSSPSLPTYPGAPTYPTGSSSPGTLMDISISVKPVTASLRAGQ